MPNRYGGWKFGWDVRRGQCKWGVAFAVIVPLLAGCVNGDDGDWSPYMAGSYPLPATYDGTTQPGPPPWFSSAYSGGRYPGGRASVYYASYDSDSKPSIVSVVRVYPDEATRELVRAAQVGHSGGDCQVASTSRIHLVHGRYEAYVGGDPNSFVASRHTASGPEARAAYDRDVAGLARAISNATGAVDPCTLPPASASALGSYLPTADDFGDGWSLVPDDASGRSLLAAALLSSNPGTLRYPRGDGAVYAALFWREGDPATVTMAVARWNGPSRSPPEPCGGTDLNGVVLAIAPTGGNGDGMRALRSGAADVAVREHVADRLASRFDVPQDCDDLSWWGDESEDSAVPLHEGANGPFPPDDAAEGAPRTWYHFTVRETKVVKLVFPEPRFAPTMEGPAGETGFLGTLEYGDHARSHAALLDPGTYVLPNLWGEHPGSTVGLEFIEPGSFYNGAGHQASEALPLEPGSQGPFSVDSGHDEDWYSFSVAKPANVTVTVASSPGDVTLDILNDWSGGNVLGGKWYFVAGQHFGKDRHPTDHMRLKPGTYYARVTAADLRLASYTVDFEISPS